MLAACVALIAIAADEATAKHRCSRSCHQRAFAKEHGGCRSWRCVERVARHHCSQRHPIPCIRRAGLHWHISFRMLLRKARCESRLDPEAIGFGVHYGLFQFLPSTFRSTPYARHSPRSAKWASLAAAWMHHVGRGSEWACR